MPERPGAQSKSDIGCLLIIYGAFIAHPVLFGLAYAWGALFGARALMGAGIEETGVEGGTNAVTNLAFAYVATFGVLPLIVSAVGAALLRGAWWVAQTKRSE
jgi:hypothetical protein